MEVFPVFLLHPPWCFGFLSCSSFLISSVSMTWSPLAAREAGEGLFSFSSLLVGGGQEGLGMAGGLSSQLVGIDQLWKISKNKCVLNHHHRKPDAPGSSLCVGCEWSSKWECCGVEGPLLGPTPATWPDHFQSLYVTLQSGFRESHLKSCWVGMGHRKRGGKGAPLSSP